MTTLDKRYGESLGKDVYSGILFIAPINGGHCFLYNPPGSGKTLEIQQLWHSGNSSPATASVNFLMGTPLPVGTTLSGAPTNLFLGGKPSVAEFRTLDSATTFGTLVNAYFTPNDVVIYTDYTNAKVYIGEGGFFDILGLTYLNFLATYLWREIDN